WMRLNADVEPHRRIERGHLIKKDMCELVVKRVAIRLGCEVAALASPSRDRARDAADELARRGLAIGRADMAAEVLRYDDVGGHLRPELRHLDVFLLEDDAATFVGDGRRSHLPFARVIDVDARLREE